VPAERAEACAALTRTRDFWQSWQAAGRLRADTALPEVKKLVAGCLTLAGGPP
jgi:hypothetical protein